jgi:flagellar hook-length control protein FliK
VPVVPPGFLDTLRARTDDATGATAAVALAAGAQGPNAPAPAAPAAPATPAAAATPAAQVADAVVTHARVLEHPGAVEFHMQLDPPELGRVQISLVARGDEVHGQVLVADDAVRQMLESQLPELRQRLEAAGVNVQRFDVATDPNSGGGRNPSREAGDCPPRDAGGHAAPPRPAPRLGRAASGTLDVTV